MFHGDCLVFSGVLPGATVHGLSMQVLLNSERRWTSERQTTSLQRHDSDANGMGSS